jgi:signal transduction histidine kinase
MRTASTERIGTVLVVDDTALNRQLLSEILSPEGYELAYATDGRTGVRHALEEHPDIVLLDLVLPDIMGIEVLEILKQQLPEIPVVLTTAFGSEETAVQALRRGVHDYIINKHPFDEAEVREVVRRAMNEAQLRRENARLQRELIVANQQLHDYGVQLERTVEELRATNSRLSHLDQNKASFFSMISHELRHPLTVAKGYLELVTGTEMPVDPETRSHLQIAEEHLKKLADMVDDLLDLSRMEAGYYKVDRQPVRVSSLMNQTKQSFGNLASATGIELRVELPEQVPLVSADPLRTMQVLANLVDNAMHFTPNGGSIVVAARDRGREIEFTVSDTGTGIPSEDLEKIFERFYQIKDPDNPSVAGAGLGLAICREIIRLHGGQIWAESELGQGTKIHFTLPKAVEVESP